MNRAAVAKALDRLQAAFPNQRIPNNTLSLYAERLAELPEDPQALGRAVKQLTERERFFPALAVVLEAFKAFRTPERDAGPLVSESEAAENRRQVRALFQRLADSRRSL